MARISGCEATYSAAELFKERCLRTGFSLLWPSERCWSNENVKLLWDAFIGTPDLGQRKFLEKWHDQLASAPLELHRVAADVLAFYYLFTLDAGPAHKESDLRKVISWKLSAETPDLCQIIDAFKHPIGGAGLPYLRRRPEQIAFYLKFVGEAHSRHVTGENAQACQGLADEISPTINYSVSARHVLLHLFFPDTYERIASTTQKHAIAAAFTRFVTEVDLDAALRQIRAGLEKEFGRQIDFYDSDIYSQWSPTTQVDEKVSDDSAKAHTPRFWVEKTIVRGRPDREQGDLALGRALWSPQRNRVGADIYRRMRDVAKGDYVFHLTDNEGITGVSRALTGVGEFNGLAGTEWGEGPSYRVRLENFQRLDPPLSRQELFTSPFRERLLAVQGNGNESVFYTSDGSLRQGAYLTPVSPELLQVLADAYRQSAGKELVPINQDGTYSVAVANPAPVYGIDDLMRDTMWPRDRLEEIVRVLQSDKPQVIFAGPPGTGKTWVAKAVAKYLASSSADRTKLVQFHPSYGYEHFVEGLQPVVNASNHIEFQAVPGALVRLTNDMQDHPGRRILIIDEMNRANLPRTFGELFYLLEYRDEAVDLLLRSGFRLPKELSIIGTMNTADRSIRSIDVALRRRFDIFECLPDSSILTAYYAAPGRTLAVPDLITGFEALNAKLEQQLDRHHTIGHTFFMTPQFGDAELKRVWDRKIYPLLEEYFLMSQKLLQSL